jgi:ribosomal protein L1
MKTDNRGLSLLELILAFALLAVISAIMLGFMVAGSRMYRTVSGEVSLQIQSQTVMAQIKEFVVDCNGKIAYDGGTLTITNTDAAHVFALENGKIYYNGDELASNVTSFRAAFDYNYGAETTVKSVTVHLTLEKGGEEYSAVQLIALRNENVT